MGYKELLNKYNQLESDFIELVMESKNICHFCKNNIECKTKIAKNILRDKVDMIKMGNIFLTGSGLVKTLILALVRY